MKKIIEIAQKNKRQVLGLMSGTSLDGLDLVHVTFSGQGMDTKIDLHHYHCYSYSNHLRNQILQAIDGNTSNVCQLHYDLGYFFGSCIKDYLTQNQLSQDDIDLISSHGQTIYHIHKRSTLQLGEADIIASLAQIPVIFDFRAADISSGGNGAPLVQYFDQYLYHQIQKKTIFLNIGGISNISYFDKTNKTFSTDIGPGNILLNLIIQLQTNSEFSYDKDGLFSQKGNVNQELFNKLYEHPFLAKSIPKSTGHEDFGMKYVSDIKIRFNHIPFEDIIRTLAVFTARTIAECCKKYCSSAELLVASGGGIKNPSIREELQKSLHPLKIKTNSEIFPFSGDAKEAIAFAFFANEKMNFESKWYPLPKISFGKLAYPF